MSNSPQPPLGPMRFKEILRNYGFGDRWITRHFAKTGLPDDHRVAETWEVCDRPGESSTIVNGPLAGQTLHQAIEQYGAALLGEAIVERFGAVFPLLIKFLDASNPLGEQAHQSDELVDKLGLKDFFGKTEAWCMVRTQPGAKVFCGNRPGVSEQGLYEALLAGTSRQCMAEYDAHPGDAFLLYAGTMHYSPGGLLFYEIMQNSDVIVPLGPYRRDFPAEEKQRRARQAVEAVHLEEGFDCKIPPATIRQGDNARTFVLACDKFALERLDLAEPFTQELDGQRFFVLSLIEGQATVRQNGSAETLSPGQSCLLPASAGPAVIEPAGSASLLKGYVPDLQVDVIAPLRAAGLPDSAILGLGGRTRLNPLAKLL